MGWGSVLAVPVIFLAVVAFWLNQPVPPNTANPIKYKILAAMLKYKTDLTQLKAWWSGEDPRIVGQRMIREAAFAKRVPDPDVLVSEEIFDGIPVMVYQPKTKGNHRPGIVYFHGGGFQFNHPVSFEPLFFRLVKRLDMVIVAPDYRLTPQVKAPVPHEDSKKATDYFIKNFDKYGVDPGLFGIGGDSAGGNLAAALSLMYRDEGHQPFLYQLVIYPWLQALDSNTPSCGYGATALQIISKESMVSYMGSLLGVPTESFKDLQENKHVKQETWEKYKKYLDIDDIPKESIPETYKLVRPKKVNNKLADAVLDDITNPHLFPLMAEDLSNLPAAYVLTVENDPIRDEGIWYAKRLKQAGNRVMHDHSKDGFHGMIKLLDPPLDFDSGKRAVENMISFMKEVMKDLRGRS